MNPGISIGPLTIHYYGIIIMSGVILAAWLAAYLLAKNAENPDVIWDALPWIIIFGIVGARIWHVLTPQASAQAVGQTTNYYFSHPLEALAVWNGGLGIPGAIIGGALALYVYCRKTKLSFSILVDAIAPGLALAQAIGRWGNFVNQELYGSPSTLPWAITIDPAYRLPAYRDVATYHPLFLYESIWNLLNMGLLLWMGKKFKEILRPGDIFLTYLIVYPVGRFLLEFLRLDPSPVAGININQTIMAVTALTAGIILLMRLKNRPVNAEAEEDDPSTEGVDDQSMNL